MDDIIAQPEEGVLIVLPSGDFLTAAEALNWIAFQRAEDVDLIGKNALWREFGFEPVLPPQVGGWDYVVAEAASMLTSEHHALMCHWQYVFGREPKNLQPARDAAARYRKARGWSAIDLHRYSTRRKELYAQRLDALAQAQHNLTNALAAERLMTWATRAVGSDPSHGSKMIGMASAVPWQFFLTPGATVQPSGKITSDSDVGYLGARFRTSEVTALWPHCESNAPIAKRRLRAPLETEDLKMLPMWKTLVAGGMSPWAASKELAPQAAGGGTDASKTKRLHDRFTLIESSTQ